MRPAAPHDESLNFVERISLRMLRSRTSDRRDARQRWDFPVLRKIRRIERTALVHAAASGAISGVLIAGAEVGLRAYFGEDRGGIGSSDQWGYWGLYLGIALVVSGAEIAYLYWRILVAVSQIGSAAGLDFNRDDTEKMMALGLSRAALDAPNPRAPIHGVDPYAHMPRWKLLAFTIVYRLKVGVTSLILRVILRRLFARAAVRSLIPFAAVGVFAVWNTVIVFWILREVRQRVGGPVAIHELDELTAEDRPCLDTEDRRLVLEAVAECVARSHDAHPNYVLFIGQMLAWFEHEAGDEDYDWEASRDRLGQLDERAQRVLLRTLSALTVLNGRPRRGQKKLLAEAASCCGRRLDPASMQLLRKAVARGQGLDVDLLDAVTPVSGH